MWANYLTVGFRNFIRSRSSSLINILGMAVGLSCCILCYLHVRYELGWDSHHEKSERIFRTISGDLNDDGWVKIAAPIPPLLTSRIPEIEGFARFNSVTHGPRVVVESNNRVFSEPWFMLADPSFLKMFSITFLKGNPSDALNDIHAVVIAESVARKLFGDEEPIGKVIKLKDKNLDFAVTAVVKDTPDQSHFRFEYLISFENLERVFGEGRSIAWGEFNYFNYFLLREGASEAEVERMIQATVVPSYDGKDRPLSQVSLQPLRDIHFQYNRGNMLPTYDIKYIYVFSAVALALLLVTCINYINLAIALSIRRVKEIGVRKAVGAGRWQLAIQFMSESFITIFAALVLGLILLEIILPVINPLLNSAISTSYTDFEFVSYIIATVIAVGLVSGSYLSFFANTHKTSSILKGGSRQSQSGFSLQHALVTVQFCISLVLIITSFIVSDQLRFIQTANIGLSYDQVINVTLYPRTGGPSAQTLKDELKKIPSVTDVAASSFQAGKANWQQTVWWEGQEEPIHMFIITVDRSFLETMNISLAEGELEAILNAPADGDQYLINESARKIIGWDAAEGKMLSPFGERRKGPVTGVVRDFNFMSLHHAMQPLVLVMNDSRPHNRLSIRINDSNLKETLSSIESTFHRVMPDDPFEYQFLDSSFQQLYESETRLGKIMVGLTAFSVLFSLVGLYGILSFNIENRTKEIAIRKVLGISTESLLGLFSKTYFLLLVLAIVIAVPVSWFIVQSWLENFSYQVRIKPLWFLLAGGVVFAAMGLLVLSKVFAFEKVNAAAALKYE